MSMTTALCALIGISVVWSIVAFAAYKTAQTRMDRLYQSVITQYLHAQTNIENHVRRHVLRDKDRSWAEGFAPLVTFGIKEDFSLMTDEELQEARKLAGLD